MSNLLEQTSTEAYRALKGGVLFDYLDTSQNGILEMRDLLEFPRRLEQAGRTEVAARVKTLYLKFWTLLNETLGRTEPRSFTREEFVKAVTIIMSNEWFRNTFMVGIAEGYFQSIDLNHDGYISMAEWRQYQKKRGMTDEAVVKATFTKLDTDGDGRISPDEVRHAYTMFGLSDDPTEDYSFIYNPNVKC